MLVIQEKEIYETLLDIATNDKSQQQNHLEKSLAKT